MSVMVVGITNGTQMVSLQLWVLPRSSRMLRILCRGVNSIVVWRVGLFSTSLRLVVTSIHTFLIPSLPLLVIGGGLVREVLLCVDLSWRSRRSRG